MDTNSEDKNNKEKLFEKYYKMGRQMVEDDSKNESQNENPNKDMEASS
ncbi:MAG: hypothetical protein WCW16_05765 [Candidatus Magasanikbacteria bacterium]